MQTHQFKCPNCAAPITFDASNQNMNCPYCDSEISLDAVKKYDDILKEHAKESEQNWDIPNSDFSDDEKENLNVYSCSSCGGEIIGDKTTAATFCPFCGNPTIISGKFKGSLKPDLIIPFKLQKEDAIEALKEHLKGRIFAPKLFANNSVIEKIVGTYIPVWLFDSKTESSLGFKGQKSKSWSDSKYIYTKTDYYSLIRCGTLDFKSVPVDGSSKMDDTLFQSLEPFDYNQAVDFSQAYLSGFFADRYDVNAETSVKAANDRIKSSVESTFMNTVSGYSNVTLESGNINLKNAKAKYALLPVYIVNTIYKGKKFSFAMNGQTGSFIGDIPISNGRRFIFTTLLSLGLGAAFYGAAWILYLAGFF